MTWRTMTRSFSRFPANLPVRGCWPVTSTSPSRTHCQNCLWVVQNSLSLAHTIRAVFLALRLGGAVSIIKVQFLLSASERLPDFVPDVRRTLDDVHPGSLHSKHLLGGSSLPARDNRTRVPHASARRRGLAGNEPDHRLARVFADNRRRLLLSGPTDFADHHHRIGIRISFK